MFGKSNLTKSSKKAEAEMQLHKGTFSLYNFPVADDDAWKRWVDYKKRETRDLTELLTSDVRDSLKKRATFLLLVPSAELNPIYWKEEVGKFYQRPEFLKSLTSDLLGYAADLIIEFCTMLKPMHCDKPRHLAQGGGGVIIHISVPDKYHDALYFYNGCILLLLTLLPEDQCERIFPLFSLRDISTYWNMDDASGYNPFQNLLYSKVDERWKRRADTAMELIIQDETTGKTKPREEWEGALGCYANIINLLLYGEKLPYSIDLFAYQIQFLVSGEYGNQKLIEDSRVYRIFQILSADIYKELRYRVAKNVVLNEKNKLSIWNDETLRAAWIMLDEFGQDDEKLSQALRSAIEENEKQATKRRNEQASVKKVEDDIMSQMR